MQRIQDDVIALTAEGREVGSPGHGAARRYIVSRLSDLDLQGYADGSFELPYRQAGQDFTNILARLPGRDPALPAVLLGAHYDTCDNLPGADDNAAAVAILLALGAELQSRPLDRNVLLAFFDAEEPPHFLGPAMGSIQFYRHQRREEIHCAVVLDLVGHDVPVPGLEDLLFITGMESDPELADVLRSCEPTSGLRTVPILNGYVGDMSDHHVFRVERRPYMLLTCGRWEHYHQATDTPDKLNFAKIEFVARYLLQLTERLCSAELDGPFEGYDSTEAELHFLKRNVSPSLESIGLGLDLKSRADIDRVVDLMLGTFNL